MQQNVRFNPSDFDEANIIAIFLCLIDSLKLTISYYEGPDRDAPRRHDLRRLLEHNIKNITLEGNSDDAEGQRIVKAALNLLQLVFD